MDNDLYKIFEKSYFNQKYYLKEFKGSGAFGAVFLADEVVGGTKIQEVAIKAIRKDKMPSDIIAKELVTAIRLKHPNLINCITSEEGRLKHSVFDYECFGLVMEIASGTLEDYLQASRILPAIEVREIVEAIASGLVYLHGQSVTHRDLKPANVLRVGNVWKISDFGIARQMGRESGTMTTSLTGTPIYMPPEVYAAYSEDAPMKVSPAWDIWSLGVMIVEMLTGALPFEGMTDIWKMNIKIKGDLPSLFSEIVQNCLLENSKKRWTAKLILEKSVQNNIEIVKDYFSRGHYKEMRGDLKGAIADYSQAIRFNQEYYHAYRYLAPIKYILADYEGAISNYNKVLNLTYNDEEFCYEELYYERAEAKFMLEDYQGSLLDCYAAIQYRNIDTDLYKDIIKAKYGMKDDEFSLSSYYLIDYYSDLIANNVAEMDEYFRRGLLNRKIGDIKQAVSDFGFAALRYVNENYIIQASQAISFIREIYPIKKLVQNPRLKTFTFKTAEINKFEDKNFHVYLQGKQFIHDLGQGIKLEMVMIPSGSFLMGTTYGEIDIQGNYSFDDYYYDEYNQAEHEICQQDYRSFINREYPQHLVNIPSFFMSKYPITQEQYEAVMGYDHSKFKGAKLPVQDILSTEIAIFLEFLNKSIMSDSHTYRLPSEAEWEYACRAGTTTPFYFGDKISPKLARYSSDYLSIQMSSESPIEVGNFLANAWGLYDMHGNVWEFCEDLWHENYQDAPTDGTAWINGAKYPDRWIIRSGGFYDEAVDCRSASRGFCGGGSDSGTVGFRVVYSVK